jgi:pescadillo
MSNLNGSMVLYLHSKNTKTILDSVNEKKLLKPLEYGIGAELPPHLSPFVDDKEEGYVPERREQLLKLASNAEVIGDEKEQEDEDEEEIVKETTTGTKRKPVTFEDEDPNVPRELETEFQVPKFEEENPNAALEEDYRRGLEAELKGEEYSSEKVPLKKQKTTAQALEAKKKLASVVLSQKKNKFYERLVAKETKKEEKQAKLVAKRKQTKRSKLSEDH